MEERRAAVKVAGIAMSPRALGFYYMNDKSVEVPELPFRPSTVPTTYLKGESKSYVLLGGHKIKQLHTDTVFGTLIIDETPNTTTQLVAPNIEIAGVPASIVYMRHRAGQWATVIYAPRGDKLWTIEADRRLDGNDRQEFIRLVGDLVR